MLFSDFRLTGMSSSVFKDYAVFNHAKFCWGTMGLMEICLLEWLYVWNNCLLIECDMTVILGVEVSKSQTIVLGGGNKYKIQG
jgi:hypothetical protein